MAMAVKLLAQMIGSLPGSEDTESALSFLKRPDLTRITPAREEAIFSSAEEFLRAYRIKQSSTEEAGLVTYGFPSLLSALDKLKPTALLTVAVFATADWYGTFWSDQADQLVGFVLVKRRSQEEEEERLQWFRRNLM